MESISHYSVLFFGLQGPQTSAAPVIVSSTAGDPSADWELMDTDDEEEEKDAEGETKPYVEARLIGDFFSSNFLEVKKNCLK